VSNFLPSPKTFSPAKPPPRASSETTLEIAVRFQAPVACTPCCYRRFLKWCALHLRKEDDIAEGPIIASCRFPK
jgi:hypothetical protein